MQVHHPIGVSESAAGLLAGRLRWFLLVAMLAVAFAAGTKVAVDNSNLTRSTPKAEPPSLQAQPGWAARLAPPVAAGWAKIQNRFHLADAVVANAVVIMADNDRYSEGHPLHDLAGFPAQVERAFGLVAASRADLGTLKNELRTHVLASSYLPDQNRTIPGLQSTGETFDDLVVFAVVERLHTVGSDPRVAEIVRALRSRS